MKYLEFTIKNYRAIEDKLIIDLRKSSLLPLVGINECGKTTILQGIFCFDYLNDNENNGKHLKNTLNLYRTNEDTSQISAFIEISYKDLQRIINSYNNTLASLDSITNTDAGLTSINNPIKKEDFDGTLLIVRDLNKKTYIINRFDSVNDNIQNRIAKDIILELPFILYNDDFNDRPITVIEIPEVQPTEIAGWLSIYERVFNSTNKNYSIFKLVKETDIRRRNSILSDVQEHLNETISKAWKSFSIDHKGNINIKINLRLNNQTKKEELIIDIIEKIGSKERYFDILDRSKGFIWYFNFIMKIQFNPKIAGTEGETIFLLDEPGSYLHASAQEKLCSKLSEISQKHGKVIYCTHSHHLLNPNFIIPNKIQIVIKNKNKSISLSPLNLFKSYSEKTNALQPVFEALQLPNFEMFSEKSKIIVVEGIFDKYTIEIFCKIDANIRIMPSTSADSIIKNIQYLITYNKDYIAIWDNDEEGTKASERARVIFGEKESQRFDKLPSESGKKRRMENMFSEKYFVDLKSLLKIDISSNYESVIQLLYYSKELRKEAIKIMDDQTTCNFSILNSIIDKRFIESNKLMYE